MNVTLRSLKKSITLRKYIDTLWQLDPSYHFAQSLMFFPYFPNEHLSLVKCTVEGLILRKIYM